MAKSLLGKMLMASGRSKDAVQHLKHSESMAKQLPYWWDDLDHIYTHKFEIK
jgi:predicted Zn-dependent protease